MNTNDQWFEPGDKVMKVLSRDELSVIFPKMHRLGIKISRRKVYCVSACWRGSKCNLVNFVGITNSTMPNGQPRGFPALAFRRVSEIQLIIRASKRQPVETVETQNV
jgi:hypothetical protein